MSDKSLLVGLPAVVILLVGAFAPGASAQSGTPDGATRARIDSAYGKLPLQFEANRGQQPAPVKFLSRGKDYTVFLTPDGATLSLRKVKSQAHIDKPGQPATEHLEAAVDLRLKLEGGNRAARMTGAGPLPGATNYLIGNDPAKWRTNVASYAKVRYEQVYPGIDLVFYGNQRQLEYDFIVAPGATPDAIRLAVEGADHTSVDAVSGDLVLAAAGREIRFHKPVVYQPESGDSARQEVEGRFQVSDNHVAFEVAAYDRARPLVVDPVLAYSTFLGGSNEDYAFAVAVDRQGNSYIAGRTCSTNFPTTAGSYAPSHNATAGCNTTLSATGSDAFIAKLNPAGTAAIFSTYIGGSYLDEVTGLAVDSTGNVYAGGYTQSPDFPITVGAFQAVCAPGVQPYPSCTSPTTLSSCPSNASGFVTKLNAAGSALIYSTFIGGTGYDGVSALALGSNNEVYVAGNSGSAPANDVLCANDLQTGFTWPVTANGYEGWPTKGLPSSDEAHPVFSVFSADGSSLLYSTLYGPQGGSGNTVEVTSMAIDAAGKAYLGGYTNYANYPTTPGAYQAACPGCVNSGRTDGFVTAFDPSQAGAASLVYSTFFGGSGSNSGGLCNTVPGDGVYGIAVDSKSNTYLTGPTCSTDFPTTHGAYQTTYPTIPTCTEPTSSAFLSKLSSTGGALDYSTFLGGSTCNIHTIGYGVTVDSAENAFVAGSTQDGTFPTVNPLFPSNSYGGPAVFVSEFNTRASALLFSTLLGGCYECSGDIGGAIHADNYGNIYVAGQSWVNSLLPITAGAFQTTYGGGAVDGFALRIALTQADLSVTDGAPATVLSGTKLTYTIGVTNNGPNTADVVTLTDGVPKGTTFVSAATSAGTCKKPAVGAASGKVTCTVPSLADGAAFTVTMVVDVTYKSGKTVIDTATVSSPVFDAVPANNSATATTTVD
jgi:uncharacterized repeat protein (TIGR01451 family)